jgi:hypothetical protein
MTFDDQETAIILAGLRLIQRQGVPDDLEDIATNFGAFDPLDDDDIDALCERINTATSEPRWGVWCQVSGGFTGPREAWLKSNGQRQEFRTQAEAEAEAQRCQADRSTSNASASFRYTARVLS